MRTAFLIDGGFFLKRYHRLQRSRTPREAARALHRMCLDHLLDKSKNAATPPRPIGHLYRIFYYDCPPLTNKAHNPITHRAVDFSRTPLAVCSSSRS